MARNGVGVYVTPNGTWTSGAANGVLANLVDWQALLEDLVDAISQSVSKDGQTVLTGDLQMGGFKLTGMGAGSAVGQTLTWEQLFAQGTETDVASAATTDIGVQNSNFLRITGTTTITSFGTNYRGPRFLRFAGAVILTNSSTLILPGGADFTTSAGNVLVAIPKATAGVADGWYIVSLPAELSSYVTLTGAQTLTNKTLDAVLLNDGYTEEVFPVTGTTPALSPTNGSIQTWTLSGNSTPTAGTWANGQSLTLMVDDGSAFTITWTSLAVSWKTNGGLPPTLNTTGFTAIQLWEVGNVIYGARVGDA